MNGFTSNCVDIAYTNDTYAVGDEVFADIQRRPDGVRFHLDSCGVQSIAFRHYLVVKVQVLHRTYYVL